MPGRPAFFASLTRCLPTLCLLCQAPVTGRPLCGGCLADLPWNTPACPRCALPLETVSCRHCQPVQPIRQHAFCAFRYQSPVKQLLNRFKHDGRLECGRLLAVLLADQLILQKSAIESLAAWPDAIMPVPLHWRRLQQRGFDQGLEIAKVLSKQLSLPIYTGLRRQRNTPSQQGLGLAERQRNLQGAFMVRKPPPYRHIALVDDVLTTGSTTDAIGQLLSRHGVEHIQLWAIARTPDPGTHFSGNGSSVTHSGNA